jgi:hypothetical protein
MSRPGAVAIVAAIAAAGNLAYAQDDDGEPKLIDPSSSGDPVEPAKENKDHFHQFGLALQIPVGVRMVAPYDSGETWCGDSGENENQNAEVCIGRQPATLDFALAFGVKPNLEVILELRLGLERDFGASRTMNDGPRLFHWSPGVKFYFSEAKISKLFSTAQIAFDHTSYDDAPGTDIFLRNINGLQFDLDPSYGLYFFVGEEMAFRRWLSLAVEFGVGFQGRYP